MSIENGSQNVAARLASHMDSQGRTSQDMEGLDQEKVLVKEGLLCQKLASKVYKTNKLVGSRCCD